MKDMKEVRLADLLSIEKGKKIMPAEEPTSIRYIQIEDLRGDANLKWAQEDQDVVACNEKDVLLAWDGANAGEFGYGLKGAVGSTLAKLSPLNGSTHTPYVGHFLKSKTPYLRSKCTGATIPHVNRRVLEDIKIPLPPLPEQRRIAAILDKAQALVANDKRTLVVYDQLAKSLFLEMFGDPVRNERGWEVVKLSGCYEGTEATRCGPFGSALKKGEYVDEGVPVWTMDSIVGFSFDPSACLYITPEKYADLTHYAVKDGDIIISRAGTVGKMCVLKSGHAHSIISTNLIKLSLDKSKLLPEVFVRLMTYFRGSVGNLRTGKEGAFTHMNTQVLDNLTIPLPPMVVQKDYMMSVEAIDVQCIRAEQSLRQSEALFGSLLQGAFAGGLGG